MDESLDISDTALLTSMIRVVFQEYIAKQEILKIPQVKGRTRGEAFKSFVSTIDMPLNNLLSITTDGAPATTGSKNGFIATFKNDESFPKCISYHCYTLRSSPH